MVDSADSVDITESYFAEIMNSQRRFSEILTTANKQQIHFANRKVKHPNISTKESVQIHTRVNTLDQSWKTRDTPSGTQ